MAAIHSQSAAEANRLQRLARQKKWEELETALMGAIKNDMMTSSDIASVIEVVDEQNEPGRTESMAWMTLSEWTERKGTHEGLALAKRYGSILPQDETLRNELTELYRKVYSGKVEDFDAFLTMTLLRKGTLLGAMSQQLDKLLELKTQPYVLDKTNNTPGKMCGVDVENRSIIVTISGQEKPYEVSDLHRLESLPGTDFRALAIFEREKLAQDAKDNPEEFVIRILKTFGPTMTFRDFKAKVSLVLVSSAWTKWWAEAKAKLLKSPMIDMTASNQPTLTLRDKPLAYEDRIRWQFLEIDSVEEQLVLILDYLEHHNPDTPPDEKLLGVFTKALGKHVADQEQAYRLAARVVLKELHDKFPQQATVLTPAPEPINEPSTLLNNIYNDEVAKHILSLLRQANPDTWYDLYAEIMPGASAGVCEWIAGELTGQGVRESFTKAIENILHWPDRYVRAIVWLCKAVTEENKPEYLSKIDLTTVFTGLLTAAQTLKRKPPITDPEQAKKALAQVKNAVTADKFKFMKKVLETANYDYAGYLRDTLPRNTGLGDAITSDMITILHKTHKGLFVQTPVPPWEEEAIYTTEAALEKKNQEYAHLVNVEIPHNAKTIGDAAEKGDLRENAEFTAALEERDRLNERAMRMRAELKKARTIYAGMANTDHVTIGSTVKAQNLATNEIETYHFLGPWDVNHEQGIYSYLSPMALTFMGKKVGETVIHNSNAGEFQWKILEITPGV